MTKLLSHLRYAHMLATQSEETDPVAIAALMDVATRVKSSIDQVEAIQRRRELFRACEILGNRIDKAIVGKPPQALETMLTATPQEHMNAMRAIGEGIAAIGWEETGEILP